MISRYRGGSYASLGPARVAVEVSGQERVAVTVLAWLSLSPFDTYRDKSNVEILPSLGLCPMSVLKVELFP